MIEGTHLVIFMSAALVLALRDSRARHSLRTRQNFERGKA